MEEGGVEKESLLQFVHKKRGTAESSFMTQIRAAVKKRGGHKTSQKGLLHLHTGQKFETGQKERQQRPLLLFLTLAIKKKDWKTQITF